MLARRAGAMGWISPRLAQFAVLQTKAKSSSRDCNPASVRVCPVSKVTLEVPRQFLPFGFTVIFRLRFECGIPV